MTIVVDANLHQKIKTQTVEKLSTCMCLMAYNDINDNCCLWGKV